MLMTEPTNGTKTNQNRLWFLSLKLRNWFAHRNGRRKRKTRIVYADDLGACCWPLPNVCAASTCVASQCIFYIKYTLGEHTHCTGRNVQWTHPQRGCCAFFSCFFSSTFCATLRCAAHTQHVWLHRLVARYPISPSVQVWLSGVYDDT